MTDHNNKIGSISFGLGSTSKRPGTDISKITAKKGLFQGPLKEEGNRTRANRPAPFKRPTISSSPSVESKLPNETGWLPLNPNKFGLQVRHSMSDIQPRQDVATTSNPTTITTATNDLPDFLKPHSKDEPPAPDVTLDQYKRLPPSAFAKEFMKRLGWQEDENSLSKTSTLAPFEIKSLPRGVGLGADPGQKKKETLAELAEEEVREWHEYNTDQMTKNLFKGIETNQQNFVKAEAMPGVHSTVRIKVGSEAGKIGEIVSLVGDLAVIYIDTAEGDVRSVPLNNLEVISLPKSATSETKVDVNLIKSPQWLIPGVQVRLVNGVIGTVLDVIREEDQAQMKVMIKQGDGRILEILSWSHLHPVRPQVGDKALIVDRNQIVIVQEIIDESHGIVQLAEDQSTTSHYSDDVDHTLFPVHLNLLAKYNT